MQAGIILPRKPVQVVQRVVQGRPLDIFGQRECTFQDCAQQTAQSCLRSISLLLQNREPWQQ